MPLLHHDIVPHLLDQLPAVTKIKFLPEIDDELLAATLRRPFLAAFPIAEGVAPFFALQAKVGGRLVLGQVGRLSQFCEDRCFVGIKSISHGTHGLGIFSYNAG
jgi:hypothetical protein